jgi:hypothetical protein
MVFPSISFVAHHNYRLVELGYVLGCTQIGLNARRRQSPISMLAMSLVETTPSNRLNRVLVMYRMKSLTCIIIGP